MTPQKKPATVNEALKPPTKLLDLVAKILVRVQQEREQKDAA